MLARFLIFCRKGYMFVKRGLLIFVSYKLQFVLSIISIFFSLVSFYFMVHFLGLTDFNPQLADLGGNYLSFLIIGSIYLGLTSVGQVSFASTLSEEQSLGTLEQLFISKTSIWHILLFSSIWNYLTTIVNMIIVLMIYGYFFQVRLHANLLSSTVILVISSAAMMGIGMISAGFILRYKKGDPISWAYGILTGLLSGIYYPVEVLPGYLQTLSKILPSTYAIAALRRTTLTGATITEVLPEIWILLLFALITVPIGLIFVRSSFNFARKQGSLGWY